MPTAIEKAELNHEADFIAERFPDVPRATIDEAVRTVYRELAEHATVRAHLYAITAAVVTSRLRAQGAIYRRGHGR